MQTLYDCMLFMLLVFVIILAFTSFFFIIDKNSAKGDEAYIEEYSGYGFLDALISVYLLSNGEFATDTFVT